MNKEQSQATLNHDNSRQRQIEGVNHLTDMAIDDVKIVRRDRNEDNARNMKEGGGTQESLDYLRNRRQQNQSNIVHPKSAAVTRNRRQTHQTRPGTTNQSSLGNIVS